MSWGFLLTQIITTLSVEPVQYQVSLHFGYNERMTVPAESIAHILGIKAKTIQQLDLMVQAGLPKRALARTLETVFVGKAGREFQSRVIPLATWKRRRSKLSTIESERTERLARIAAMAREVWNGEEPATREWLNTPHRELGNMAPVEVSLTEIGARRVEALLAKIYYGLPA